MKCQVLSHGLNSEPAPDLAEGVPGDVSFAVEAPGDVGKCATPWRILDEDEDEGISQEESAAATRLRRDSRA